MIGRLNHVAIVVPDLATAAATYRDVLGATVSTPRDLPEHGVTVVFVDLPNTKIELLERNLARRVAVLPAIASHPFSRSGLRAISVLRTMTLDCASQSLICLSTASRCVPVKVLTLMLAPDATARAYALPQPVKGPPKRNARPMSVIRGRSAKTRAIHHR